MSAPRNPNSRATVAIAEELERSGVTDACVSPGSRSTAIVTALLRGRIRPWVVLDERAAGFFAMGLAREIRRPVIVACTSGTAAANHTPAVAEASLLRVPLIMITADRPPEARDCRSPQTIDQVRMFGTHARWSVDVATPSAGADLDAYYRTLACRAVSTALGPPAGPVHLNLPMREPLIDVTEEVEALCAPQSHERSVRPYVSVLPFRTRLESWAMRTIADEIRGCERGVIVCGPAIEPGSESPIAALSVRLGWPILADPLSGLRFGIHDRSLIVDSYDVLLRDPEFAAQHQPDAVIQFGDPPVSKALGQFLAARRRDVHLIVAEPMTWPDPSHIATQVARIDTPCFCAGIVEALGADRGASDWSRSWLEASRVVRSTLDKTLADEAPMFEGKVVSELLRLLPAGSLLHVGNSMPVRDLDTFAGNSGRMLTTRCNRGANGIDGVLSTAIGAAAARRRPTALLLGDLSFLHDVSALHIAARYPINLLVVVVNNDGGGIFSFLSQSSLGDGPFETFFGTPHGLDFEQAAALGRARYARADSWGRFQEAVETAFERGGLHVVEVPGDRARNLEAHRRMIAGALDRMRAWRPADGAM